jgi:hypothetical protein
MGKFGISRRHAAGVAMTWSLGVMLGDPQLASAVGTYTAAATAGVEYNSNIFDVPTGTVLPNGQTGGGDVVQTYSLEGDATLAEGPETLTLAATGTHYQYDTFSYLSHNDVKATGNLGWSPGQVLELHLQYSYVHAMGPFAQTLTQTFSMDTTKIGTVLAGLKVTPVWRVDLSATDNLQLTPELGLPGGLNFPNFQLDEKSGSATLNYLGVAHVTAGVSGSYAQGIYSNIPGATRYNQYTLELVSKYKIDDLTSFTGNVGYSRRNTTENPAGSLGVPSGNAGVIVGYFVGAVGVTGGLTGTLAYTHTLSPKTMIDVSLYRTIGSYVPGANNAMVTTGLGADVHWKPDVKLELTVGGTILQDQFTGTAANAANRTDRAYSGQVQLRWNALRWLGVIGHGSYNLRDSNFNLAGYSAWVVGLDLAATLK